MNMTVKNSDILKLGHKYAKTITGSMQPHIYGPFYPLFDNINSDKPGIHEIDIRYQLLWTSKMRVDMFKINNNISNISNN